MKFGQYLEANMVPEWHQHYVRYNHLKQMLKDIVTTTKEAGASFVTGGGGGGGGDASGGERGGGGGGSRFSTGPRDVPFTPPKNLAQLSLTFRERRPGESSSSASAVTETAFFEALDDDMDKVRGFVEVGLERLRGTVDQLAAEVDEAVR